MPLHILDENIWFPPVTEALSDGLLAVGGDLSTKRLLLAYSQGIFPWYEDEIPLWWCPNPRFVLFPQKLKMSKSMRSLMKKQYFEYRVNTAFEQVIQQCQTIKRKDQEGTWINQDIIKSYTQLHRLGYAHSVEAWRNHQLVGGFYGIQLGKVFFGESMFAKETNASKFAFIHFVLSGQVDLVDCQIYSQYLESLGAEMIEGNAFQHLLANLGAKK